MNVHAQRLLNVARSLKESRAPAKFDMGTYGHSRGTPACALGHYAARTDLQNVLFLSGTGDLMQANKARGGFVRTDYDDSLILSHFGLTDKEVTEIFGCEGCGEATNPEDAAAYIENFVAEKWPDAKKAPDWNALASEPLPASERVSA